ncbi:complex I subunit 4 family protein [Paenibacillus sp. y28]|uniref:complex I subunit 4 family protein n=1 Tax=Paenibacillus sp. y28 TaxID=3129110 RepID=UPI00301614E6
MLDGLPILSLIVLSPLAGIILLACIPKERGRLIRAIGIMMAFVPFLLSLWLYAGFNQQSEGLQFTEQHTWIQLPLSREEDLASEAITDYYVQFAYSLGVDGLSMALVLLTGFISSMAALASVYVKKRWKSYYILFLLLEAGMLGVFTAQDLLLFFVFFEMTLIPMFFLVGIWGYMNREKAANSFLIYNGVGSAVMFIAFLLLITTAGMTMSINEAQQQMSFIYSGDLQTISANLLQHADSLVNRVFEGNPFYADGAMRWTMFVLLLVAFGIKLPIFPFHSWMLRVHTEAPPSVVMIHAGVLLKMGAYGLLRFGILLFPQEAKAGALVLAVLGVVNILYGALLAMRQREFKLILAYSSISHMGIVLLGLAAFNEIGLQGAIFQLVSHGLISALLFLIVGNLYERTATTQIDRLGGLAKSIPFTSGMLLIAGMASLGLPLLSGFISEFLALLGLFGQHPVVTTVGAVGVILTAVYVLRGILRITYGPLPDAFRDLRDARLVEAVPMILLVAFIVLIGIWPSVLSEPLGQTVSGFYQTISAVTKTGG